MKTTLPSVGALLLCALWANPLLIQAEGSKQLTPNTAGTSTDLTNAANTRAGFLTHDATADNASLGFLKPATWTGANGTIGFSEDYRMYVRLLPGETLNYGVHRIPRVGSDLVQSDLVLTLRYGAGAGTLVQQTTLRRDQTSTNDSELLPAAGVIGTAAEVQAGPLPAAGGYNPLRYTNTTGATQDIYVEFTQVNEAALDDEAKRSEYDFWDFTVRDASGAEKPGRLFSKHWAFSAGQSNGTNFYLNRLSTSFRLFPMVQSVTSPGQYYVKEVNLSGMRPYLFYFVCNEFGSSAGTAAGTTVESRRQSQTSRTSYPQYPSFINNPDPVLWPSAPLPVVSVTPQEFCRNGRTEVAFTTTSAEAGQFDILIDLNGTAGYQPGTTDVLIRQTVSAGVSSTVVWNGKNGNGADVAKNTVVKFDFISKGAPVNFPVYDAEGNPSGFKVRNVRPGNGADYDLLYWDDSKLTNFSNKTEQLTGVNSQDGVHKWGLTSDEGNGYTVNSWTYGFSVFQGAREFTYTDACDHDTDGVTDATDVDDDNDGILDVVEAITPTGTGAINVDPNAFASGTSPIRYLDVAYQHPILGAFLDTNNDGLNDLFDTDRDGIPNHFDLDADNDGLPDAFEANGNANPAYTFSASTNAGPKSSAYNPNYARFMAGAASASSSSVGTNGLPDAVKQTISYKNNGDVQTENGVSKYTLTDHDRDEKIKVVLTARNYNFLDIDSDNDGITDEIEAQTTSTYDTRKANTTLFARDSDKDGLRDSYDPNNGGTAISAVHNGNAALRAADTTPDMFDADSDGDNAAKTSLPIYQQTGDWTEGFDDNRDGVAGDDILARARLFATNNPAKAGYYPVTGLGSGTVNSPFLQDSDNDDTPNFLDLNSAYYHDDNFNGLVDLYDPAYGGTPSLAPKAVGATEAMFRAGSVGVPLPVELIGFQARANGIDGLLTWATAQEKDNAGFEVERSADGATFVQVGRVAGAGTTTRRTDYRFVDKGAGVVPGLRYYRLRQVDVDGTSKYSNVEAVLFTGSKGGLVAVYPNPAADEAKLDLTALPLGTYTVEILGAEGRNLARLAAQAGELLPLPTSHFAKGTYLVRVSGNGLTQVVKLVKM